MGKIIMLHWGKEIDLWFELSQGLKNQEFEKHSLYSRPLMKTWVREWYYCLQKNNWWLVTWFTIGRKKMVNIPVLTNKYNLYTKIIYNSSNFCWLRVKGFHMPLQGGGGRHGGFSHSFSPPGKFPFLSALPTFRRLSPSYKYIILGLFSFSNKFDHTDFHIS